MKRRHVAMLKQGVDAWNAWRDKNQTLNPDLSNADLGGAQLGRAYLVGANLSEANLHGARLNRANLHGAHLHGAYLVGANLSGANLDGADLSGAYLVGANLSGANLSGANLAIATLVDTNLTGADLIGSCVYGVSAWRLELEGTKQENLVITRDDEPAITVDNIEVAQFIYLLLHNKKIRDVIETQGGADPRSLHR